MKVAAIGRTKMLYDTIDELIQDGHEIVLIGTCKAALEYDIKESDFEEKARELNVPFFCDSHINDAGIINVLKESCADVAVSVNWLTIINKQAISCFKYGILNAHCGDLPKYRGNACPNWAIINGENRIGISIHYMNAGELDSGDIILRRFFPLTPETTISDVYSYIEKVVPEMFSEAVGKIADDSSDVTAQSRNPDDVLRCYPRTESDSYIDWNQTIDHIDRIIRASCRPFKGAYTYYGSKKYYILKASKDYFKTPVCVVPGQIVGIDKNKHVVSVASMDGIINIESMEDGEGNEILPDQVFYSMRMRLGFFIPDEIFSLKKEIMELKCRLGEKDNR